MTTPVDMPAWMGGNRMGLLPGTRATGRREWEELVFSRDEHPKWFFNAKYSALKHCTHKQYQTDSAGYIYVFSRAHTQGTRTYV